MLRWASARNVVFVAMAFLAVATGILASGILNPEKAEAYENNAVYFYWDVICNEYGEPVAVRTGPTSELIQHIHPTDYPAEVGMLAPGLSAVVCTGGAAVTLYDNYYYSYVNCITLPGGTNGSARTHFLANRNKLEKWQVIVASIAVGAVGLGVTALVAPVMGPEAAVVTGLIVGGVLGSGLQTSWNDKAKSLRVGWRAFENDAISSFKVSNGYQADTVILYKDANGKGTEVLSIGV